MAIKKKIVLLGDSAVGKTSLIRRFVFDKFDDSYISTIGSKVTRKELRVQKGDQEIDLNMMIWDILGRRGYTAIHARTFAGVHGALLVADMTRRETLVSLERYWIPLLFKVVEYVPLLFVCNKSDIADETEFSMEDLEEIASRYNVGLGDDVPEHLDSSHSTSAKTGDNVERAFKSLGHLVLSDRIVSDPVKELYEELVAYGIHKKTDIRTPIASLDAIFVDVCEEFDDDRNAMSVLRQEIVRAGVDIRSPSRQGLLKLVEYLAEAESEYLKEHRVVKNKERRMEWVKASKE
jgi:small GTP-binding protein